MKGKPKRPLRGLALLGAAAVAVVAAATVWLRTGWTTIGLTLTDRIGNAAQDLQGFTLDGTVGWTRTYDILYFRLENGTLQTEFRFDNKLDLYHNIIGLSRNYVLQPEVRNATNADATLTSTTPDGTRTITGFASDLRCMYTLIMPDNTLVRLSAGDFTLDDLAQVQAWDSDTLETSFQYDYQWSPLPSESSEQEYNELESTFPLYPASSRAVWLGNDYGLCWKQELGGWKPGLYRVHGLTNEEIGALPRDGKMYDKDVLCASTEFGDMIPFYCPADAKTALGAAEIENGFTLLLYQNSDGILCADLVTSAGQLSDHRELGSLPEADRYDGKLLPRRQNKDALFAILCDQKLPDGSYMGTYGMLAALRVENGHFTVAHALKYDGSRIDAAVLNETGDGILTAYVKGNTFQYGYDGSASLSGHLELAAYDLATGHMTYSGTINTGDGPYWENQQRNNSTFEFAISPQDRGFRA